MEKYELERDIRVLCIQAKTYPEGIPQAHEQLHRLMPFSAKRNYFGISRPENGSIVYRAGAEELMEGELSKFRMEEFVLKKGDYIFKEVIDYRKNIQAIGSAFKELLRDPRIDPQGCCVEWYVNDHTCRCMVRLS
jgi:hypothetical protein